MMRGNQSLFFKCGVTYYFVTRDGRVLSTKDPVSNPATWHEIAQYNGKGYRRVRLRGKTFKVHRLVAEAFLQNPDRLPYVIHLDGDKTNNHADNLQWSNVQSNHGICCHRAVQTLQPRRPAHRH